MSASVMERAPARTTEPGAVATRRRHRRPLPVPSGRAVLGGLLVALAALGTYVAIEQANRPPTTRYLVATETIPAGTVLGGDAPIEAVVLELPPSIAGRTYSRIDQLAGRVTRRPIEPGQLVQPGLVADPGEQASGLELTIGLDPARALGGELQAGDRVDVVATADGCAALVAAAVPVRDVSTSDAGLGDGDVVVTLTVADRAGMLAVVQAAEEGDLTLARPSAPVLDEAVPGARCGMAGTSAGSAHGGAGDGG